MLVELANRLFLQIIKTKLDDQKSLSEEELPRVLWAYPTTVRTSTSETLFTLTYWMEAVIPIKIGALVPQVVNFIKENKEEGKKLDLDLFKGKIEDARLRMATYKQKIRELLQCQG